MPPRTPAGKRAKAAEAAAPLSEYSAKRAFDATPEPAPAVASGAGPLLFVVQQHSARQLHYDFRLDCEGVLKSWAVPRGPALDPGESASPCRPRITLTTMPRSKA